MTKGIYSTRCWIEGQLQPATVSFENGMITGIEKNRIQNETTEDVGDAILMPGAIDAHVHINEPGRTEWEGFDTATQAAAAGGTTTVVDMPLNSSPVTTTAENFQKKLRASEGKLHVNCGFYGGLIPGSEGDLEALLKTGILGIKVFLVHSGIDEFPNVTEEDLRKAMPVIKKYNLPLLAHCELVNAEGALDPLFPGSYRKYLSSRPKSWENDAIEMVIGLCRESGCRTHIVHLSSAEALQSIKMAKKEGLPLKVESCPHYLYFSAETIPDNNTLYKCAPPVREKDNNLLLKNAFADGTLDFITTDHSPAPPALKELESGNLIKAWGGIAGIQFLLPASWTSLKDILSLETFIPLLTEHPATFLGINDKKGAIKIGYDADLVVWSPEKQFDVVPEGIFYRHPISPYCGEKLWGIVQQTYVNGVLVFRNNKIINKKAGKWLFRK